MQYRVDGVSVASGRGWTLNHGDVVDETHLAFVQEPLLLERYLARGYLIPLDGIPRPAAGVPETAMMGPPVEAAVLKRPRGRPRKVRV